MTPVSRIPSALSIAGSDSGGGAGVQADLKVWTSLGVHGTTVLTCVTAQHPGAVTGIQPLRSQIVRQQLEAVLSGLPPAAAKTGMLFSAALIREVAAGLAGRPRLPLVVDPVMVATSGAMLLQKTAIRTFREKLLPLATLVTPNLDEVRVLTGVSVRDPEDLRRAARRLRDEAGCAVLVKGGHLPGPEAVDLFWDGHEELLLSSPRVRGVSSHGTGCTFSAAITAALALGLPLVDAVRWGKRYITAAIMNSRRVGRFWVLGAVPRIPAEARHFGAP